MSNAKDILLLALGNDILGDDGAGLHAARLLREEFADRIIIEETAAAGLVLMEIMEGFRRVLLLDAIKTGKMPPGTVQELRLDDFTAVRSPSAHWIGLPEVFETGRRLGLTMADDLRILALEVEDPYRIGTALGPVAERSLPLFVSRARDVLLEWLAPDNIVYEN